MKAADRGIPSARFFAPSVRPEQAPCSACGCYHRIGRDCTGLAPQVSVMAVRCARCGWSHGPGPCLKVVSLPPGFSFADGKGACFTGWARRAGRRAAAKRREETATQRRRK